MSIWGAIGREPVESISPWMEEPLPDCDAGIDFDPVNLSLATAAEQFEDDHRLFEIDPAIAVQVCAR